MGLRDFFRRTKTRTPLLDSGRENEEEGQKEKKIDVQIFSKKMENNGMQYSIVLKSEENTVLVGEVSSFSSDNNITTRKNIELKKIAKKINEAIEPMAEANVKNQCLMEKAKKQVKENMQRIAEKENVVLTKEIMQYINQYEGANSYNNQTNDEHKQMDDRHLKRLQELKTIKTPEDAYAHKDSLIAYMQQAENVPSNPIIEANIKSLQEGKRLDDETVKRIAQNMESLNNEDGFLYAVYLKIEEKRIWRQLQTRLAQYSNNSNDKEIIKEIYQLSGLLENLNGYELPDTIEGFSPSVLEYMINEMKEKNIENYIENIKENDVLLARIINTKCDGIQDKTEMLQFLYARIGSLGQLSYKSVSEGRDVLRNFIADTNFKHEDNTESKQFLLMVANIEKQYIQSQYDKTKHKSLKERIHVQTAPIINLSEQPKFNERKGKEEKERIA